VEDCLASEESMKNLIKAKNIEEKQNIINKKEFIKFK
jgi:hypothetical protein